LVSSVVAVDDATDVVETVISVEEVDSMVSALGIFAEVEMVMNVVAE
jgi:hypothetical protein